MCLWQNKKREKKLNSCDPLFVFLQKMTSSLKIHRAEDHALYRCTAYNKIGEDSRVIFFHVTRKTPFVPTKDLMHTLKIDPVVQRLMKRSSYTATESNMVSPLFAASKQTSDKSKSKPGVGFSLKPDGTLTCFLEC